MPYFALTQWFAGVSFLVVVTSSGVKVRFIILLLAVSILIAGNANTTLFVDETGNYCRKGLGMERVWVTENTSGGLPSTPLWDVLVDTTGSVTRLYVCAGLAFASQHGGVFVSDTDGLDWDSLSSAFANDFVLSLAMDRSNTDILLAGTDSDGIYRSSDAGVTWSPVLSSQKTRHIVFDESSPNIVYCGNEGTGVFKSTDAGVSWFPSSAGMSLVNAVGIGVDVLDSNHMYVIWEALNSGGVFRTSDGGNSWTPSPNLPSQRQTGIAVDPTDGDIIYVCNSGPWNAGMDDGVYKSTDGGSTWVNNWTFSDTAELGVVAVATSDPNMVFAGGNKWLQPFGTRIWGSTDAGGNWTLLYDNPTKQFVEVVSIAIDPVDPQLVYAGTRANGSTVIGVLKTTDGGTTWAEANNGLSNLSVLSLAVDPSDNSRIVAATAGGVFLSTDYGGTWNPTDSLGYTGSVALRSDSVMYAGTLNDGVYRSTNFGSTWQSFSGGMSLITPVNDIEVDPSNQYRVHAALSNIGAYTVVDTGVGTWFAIGPFGGDVNWLEIVQSDHQILYSGTQSGIFKSTDGGAFWEKCVASPSGETKTIRASWTGDTVHAGASGYYRSLDGGAIWDEIVLPTEPYNEVTALSVDPYSATTVYLGLGSYLSGSYCHILKSTDGGGSWVFKCGGLPFSNTMEVSSIGINPMNTLKLYATFGSGFFGTSDFFVSLDGGEIWTHPVGVAEREETRRARETRMTLYPCPFRDKLHVRIEFGDRLEGTHDMRLEMCDAAGRLVGSVSLDQHPLDCELTWHDELPSGVYFVSLRIGDERITRRTILLR